MSYERICLMTQYILDHFDQKTYRSDKTYSYNTLINIGEVALAKQQRKEEEVKQKYRNIHILSGIFKNTDDSRSYRENYMLATFTSAVYFLTVFESEADIIGTVDCGIFKTAIPAVNAELFQEERSLAAARIF